ncbi:MAG: HesA/MoeB/ThiF family protein [Desulfosarcina sp.]
MTTTLSARLDTLAREVALNDGTPCRTIAAAEVMRLSEEVDLSGRLIEIAALRQDILPDRYLRNMRTLTMADQIRLLESAVCVVGLGGLGGLVTDTLARLGIGRLHLIDGDRFEAHNLNRQLMSSMATIGNPKTEAAAMNVRRINPGIIVNTSDTYLTTENAETLVASCNLAVDCLDNIRSRFALETATKRTGIPMVSAAVAGMSGHVTTIFPGGQGLADIYGPEEALKADHGVEAQLGCLAPGVNLIASLECAEALKILLGRDGSLVGKLLIVDLADYTFEALQLG